MKLVLVKTGTRIESKCFDKESVVRSGTCTLFYVKYSDVFCRKT